MKRGETTIYKGHGTPLPGLAQRVAHFARFLKGHGFRVFQSSVHDALRGLDVTGVLRKEDFRSVLRTNLVTNDLEWAQFPDLFGEFWDQEQMMTEDPDGEPLSFEREEADADSQTLLNPDAAPERTGATGDAGKKEWLEGVAYSPVSGIRRKNLSSFDKRDIRIAQLALKRIVEPFRIHPTRRLRRSKRPGDVDFRRILKESLSTGGLPMELFYKERRKHLKRLVILADVSGSMDRYARFVMPFILGLRGGGSRTEVFVFSTSLTSITFMVRHMSVEKALERISQEVPDWSGGTKIGYAIHRFNQDHAERLLGRRTVVVILSDGWDLGGRELLRREMATLSRKAHSVIWLNPLAGNPDYRPVCQGMRIALPYVDHFLPADSLESLTRVGRLLSRVLTH